MVDGKGGNLKTIHHYVNWKAKTARATSQNIPWGAVGGKEGNKPPTDLQNNS
jgi:hypothetical protein